MPSVRYSPATCQALRSTGICAEGSAGVSRFTHMLPSEYTTRTSASVIVRSNPAIRNICPRNGSIGLTRQVCTAAPPDSRVVMGVRFFVCPENSGSRARRRLPRMGVFQSASNSPA